MRQSGNSFEEFGVGHFSIVQFPTPRFWSPIRRSSSICYGSRAQTRRARRAYSVTLRRGRNIFENSVCNLPRKGYDFEMPPRSTMQKALCIP
jgi:hypothetical protein